MAITLTGAQLKAFESSPEVFPGNAFWEGYGLKVDGRVIPDSGEFDIASVSDAAAIELSGGDIHRGNGIESAEAVLARWLNESSTTILVVEVSASKADQARAAIRSVEGVIAIR